MALVTRNALKGGRKIALLTSLGIVSGLLVWTVASALGLAILLEANAFAFTAVKLAGAAYLTFLGARALVSNWRHAAAESKLPTNHISIIRVNSPYAQGLLTNILNPKIAILFTSLIPQFITPGSSVTSDSVELAGIFVIMGLAWLIAFSFLAGSSRNLIRLPKVRRLVDTLTGFVLIGLGIKVAMETM